MRPNRAYRDPHPELLTDEEPQSPVLWRQKLLAALERHLARRSHPRVVVAVLLLATGLVGFSASVTMLKLGLAAMWLRYPLALLFGYAVFLGMVRLWAEVEFGRLVRAGGLGVPGKDGPQAQREHRKGSSDEDWRGLDLPTGDWDPGDGGCLLLVIAGALAGVGIALCVVVSGAPALLAEVLLDAVLVAAFYQRLRSIERRHWFATAVGRTWLPALSAALLLALAGWAMHAVAPGATSIGQVVERWGGAEER